MIIGTTPTFTFKFKRNSTVDLSSAQSIYATFKQGNHILTKTGTDINIIDSKTVSVQFTQVESLEFTIDKKIEAQLNWIFIDSGITRRAATKVKIIELDKQLLKEVIH